MTTQEPETTVTIVPPEIEDAWDGPLLEIKALKTHFDTREGVVRAVDEVTLHVNRGEVLGVVGESGCGKAVMSFSIMGLVPKPGKGVAFVKIIQDIFELFVLYFPGILMQDHEPAAVALCGRVFGNSFFIQLKIELG